MMPPFRQYLVYIDDIIILGSTFQQMLHNLEQVRQRLRPRIESFFTWKVSFLEHIVSERGLKCDPAKIQAVSRWPISEMLKDIHSFLGLASYYR